MVFRAYVDVGVGFNMGDNGGDLLVAIAAITGSDRLILQAAEGV